MSDDDNLPPYEVILSPTAEIALMAIGSRADLRSVDNVLQALSITPGMGRTYDPLYEAAMPEEPIMVAYAGHFGIYYDVDERGLKVNVAYIEDQRTDPTRRFGV